MAPAAGTELGVRERARAAVTGTAAGLQLSDGLLAIEHLPADPTPRQFFDVLQLLTAPMVAAASRKVWIQEEAATW
jgi:hypothetical protein